MVASALAGPPVRPDGCPRFASGWRVDGTPNRVLSRRGGFVARAVTGAAGDTSIVPVQFFTIPHLGRVRAMPFTPQRLFRGGFLGVEWAWLSMEAPSPKRTTGDIATVLVDSRGAAVIYRLTGYGHTWHLDLAPPIWTGRLWAGDIDGDPDNLQILAAPITGERAGDAWYSVWVRPLGYQGQPLGFPDYMVPAVRRAVLGSGTCVDEAPSISSLDREFTLIVRALDAGGNYGAEIGFVDVRRDSGRTDARVSVDALGVVTPFPHLELPDD